MRQRLLSSARYVAVFGLVFQGVHLIEHMAQLGYWVMHPLEAPWLTPWAEAGRDMLVVGGKVASGNELLHLIGNLIFIAGIVGLYLVATTLGERPSRIPFLRRAMISQAVHVGEHVALTTTFFAVGVSIGLSTGFGLLSGPVASGYRVWFHFLLNLLATVYAFRALWAMHRRGMILPVASPRAVTA
jgi:hypothetical protein